MSYDHKKIDAAWQKRWEEEGIFAAEDDASKEKFYCLIEFPYPSGAGLHLGHPRSYAALDVVVRKARMEGKNVLYPIGWDAFGLPTENYAIKTGRSPQEVTKENTDTFRRQLKSLGISFDWSREVNTTDPKYYRWTQWMFNQFFKAGLAYKAKKAINWCLSCKIGLANEEVVNGSCERCGGDVEKRDKEQWMIAITKYADRLIEDLETVDYLPKIAKQQVDWIGRSEGASIEFPVDGADQVIEVFTTRPDTIMGATFMVMAPEHPLVDVITTNDQRADIETYVAEAVKKTDIDRGNVEKEKTGVFTGAYAVNPGNGEKIPIWIADYVMMGYGTGAIMAVPGHDERDFAFAKKFEIPIVDVVAEQLGDRLPESKKRFSARAVCVKDGKMLLTYDTVMKEYILPGGGLDEGEDPAEAILREIREETGYVNTRIVKSLGTVEHNYLHTYHKQNWLGIVSGFEVEIIDEEITERLPEEIEKTDFMWLPLEEGKKALQENAGTFTRESEFITRLESEGDFCFAGDGVAINSDFLDGMTTDEAKSAIIEWLEESGHGKRTINYKLRDWIFSRQRYWGEPIPLVHCEKCAEGEDVMAFHGWDGSATSDFFPALKVDLANKGHGFSIDTAPNSEMPVFDEWFSFAESKLKGKDTSAMTLVGHSMGGHLVLKLAEKYSFKRIVLVAPVGFNPSDKYFDQFKDDLEEVEMQVYRAYQNHDLDVAAVVKNVPDINFIFSDNDQWIRSEIIDYYKSNFSEAQIQMVEGAGHFSTDSGVTNVSQVEQLFSFADGWLPVPDDQLPVELPIVEKYEPTDDGESPLAAIEDWVNTTCPSCDGPARRETDTMPNWAGSSWYFLRYIDPHNDEAFASKEKLKYWMPVDLYNGGMEHTTLHLLYSRFWNKFLFDQGHVPTSEPYARRHSHGLILAEDGTKMSKSKGNVINPDEIVEKYGADTLRLYEAFIGPFEEAVPWSTNGLIGVRRFLDKVMRLAEMVEGQESEDVTRALHKTIKKVTKDIDGMRFNTAVAQLMTFVNVVNAAGSITHETLKSFLTILCPLAPHVANEAYALIGGEGLLDREAWPKHDEKLTIDDVVTIAVQVNGKLRGTVDAAPDASEEDVAELAREDENVIKFLTGEPKKTIYVQGKLINFVL